MVLHDLLSAEQDAAGADPGDAGDRLRRAISPRYLVERRLARGAMGLVFLARDTRHDRLVAIKLLDPERAAAIGSERFLREIQAAAQLVHPNILPVFESGEADGLLYYVMPFVEGESLRELLARDGALPLEDAVALAADLAEALDCAHRHGVVHRDVKPENILLPAPHHACLTDFGVAHAPSGPSDPHLTSAGRLLGSPLYMSPEQAAGYADVDGRADVYGLGCVLFEMLAGRPPFTGERVETVLIGHLSESPPPLRSLRADAPPWLEVVVARTLAKVPEERFSTAGELAEALKKGWRTGVGEGTAVEAPPVGAPRRRWRARRALLMTVAGLTLAAGAGTGVWLWRAAHARGSGLNPNRVAVLYFEDLSPGERLGALANGLTAALVQRLGQVSVLDVVPLPAVRPFRGSTSSPANIARAVRAGTILDGRVQASGDRVRVLIQLIDAATGSLPVSTTIERTSGDMFALEDDVGDEVARFLRQQLGQRVRLARLRAETRSVEAWQLFREAERLRDGLRQIQPYADSARLASTSALLLRADSLYARAQGLDPQWIAPTVERGWVAIDQADLHTRNVAWNTYWLRAAQRQAAAAASRRPGDPRVLELSGKVAFRAALDAPSGRMSDSLWVLAERELRAATQADASRGSAWALLSTVLQMRGRLPEAIMAGGRALEEDAYLRDASDIISGLFYGALQLGDTASANEWCARGEHEYPTDPGFADCRLQLMGPGHVGTPDPQRAWQLLSETERRVARGHGEEGEPDMRLFRRMMVAAVLARAGFGDSARAVMRRQQQTAASDHVLFRTRFAFYAAQVEVILGNRDRALEWLTVYLSANPAGRELVAGFFPFHELRSDPRFQALVRRRT